MSQQDPLIGLRIVGIRQQTDEGGFNLPPIQSGETSHRVVLALSDCRTGIPIGGPTPGSRLPE